MLERFAPWSPDWWQVSADHLARYQFAVSFVPGKRVLDAGTGYGYGAAILATYGAAAVVGVDIDAEVVAAARGAFPLPNLRFEVDDCERLAAVGSGFDVVVSFENIEHLAVPREFLRAAAGALAPDGVLVCSTPDRSVTPPFVGGKPANPYHVNEWYAEEFTALLQESFGEVELLAQLRSGASEARRSAAGAVQQFLRTNTALRAYRFACRLLGRTAFTPLADRLGTPDPGDYPIHPRAVARLFGLPWCHVAVCRRPGRGELL